MRYLKRAPKAAPAPQEPKQTSAAMLVFRDVVVGIVVSICGVLAASFYFQPHLEAAKAGTHTTVSGPAKGASK